MIPIHPLRKYHDNEGEEDGLPLTGVRHYTGVTSERALQRLRYQQKVKKRNHQLKLEKKLQMLKS